MKPSDRFFAKKSLGQHFLVNPRVRQRIVEACHLTGNDDVLEIGPGRGAITGLLAERVKHVTAVETDQRCLDVLTQTLSYANVTLLKEDILRFSFDDLPARVKVVSNLPYNIASPILERLLNDQQRFPEIYIMVQLEFGERMAAQPGSKDYSAFSCFVQYYADAEILFKIAPGAFQPPPKVQSCFMKLTAPARHGFHVRDEKKFFNLIRLAFQQRRKTLVNALSSLKTKQELQDILKRLGIPPLARAENLSLRNYGDLFEAMG